MRKKKGARSKATASSAAEEDESVQLELPLNNENDAGEEGEGFFACYLLASLNPRFKGHTYIGLGSSIIFSKT
ncbi:excinuclease ABC, partial [Trifolium medium]|nr:excinuclease ABC [Trifolium medium]